MNKKQLLVFHKCALFLYALVILTACSRNNAPIMIHFFSYENPAISAPIDAMDPSGWRPLLDTDLNQSEFKISERDIVGYDEEVQKIVVDGELKESFLHDEILPLYSYFVLTLGETPIVGGVILPQISPLRVEIPELRVSFLAMHPENPDMEMFLGIDMDSSYPSVEENLMKYVHNRLRKIEESNK